MVNSPRQPVELNRVIATSLSVCGTGKSALGSIGSGYCISTNVIAKDHQQPLV